MIASIPATRHRRAYTGDMGHIGVMEQRRVRLAVYAMRACVVASCVVIPATVVVFAVVAFGTPGELIARRRAGAIH